jgi:hypothetical protein
MAFILNTSDIAVGAAMPFKSGMLDFMSYDQLQNSRNILRGITNNSNIGEGTVNIFCLNGARSTVVGTTYTIEGGSHYFNLKFYNSEPITITLSPGQAIIGNIVKSNPFVGASSDPVIFSDSSSHNVLDFYQIVWSAGTSGSGDFDYNDLIYFNDVWHTIGATGEPAYENSYVAASSATIIGSGIAYKKDYSGKVEFKGGCSKTPLTTSDVFTLPVDYRPTYNKSFMAISSDTAGVNPCLVKITASTGKVNVTPLSPSGLGVISFESLSFYID